MHLSLLVQYVSASAYPSEVEALHVCEQLKPILFRITESGKHLSITQVNLGGIPTVVAMSISTIPESISEELDTILSLPPGKRFEIHSDIVQALILYLTRQAMGNSNFLDVGPVDDQIDFLGRIINHPTEDDDNLP